MWDELLTPIVDKSNSCSETGLWIRDQGKGEREPVIPAKVSGQAGYLVSHTRENRLGSVAVTRLRQGVFVNTITENYLHTKFIRVSLLIPVACYF